MTLAPATEIAAARDEEPCQDDGKDGRQPGAEGRPMDIDETEPVVGLVQLDVVRLIGGGVVNGEGRVVFHVDGRGWGRSPLGFEVFLDLLLHLDAFENGVTGAEQEGGHDEVGCVELGVGETEL